jgi:hypothetical protein
MAYILSTVTVTVTLPRNTIMTVTLGHQSVIIVMGHAWGMGWVIPPSNLIHPSTDMRTFIHVVWTAGHDRLS